ncbi:RNA polymerase sigma factor [Pendulispora albinea]|uniref:Sigma-70 family RNA polymerase sigma factor n=1 Tax=Pendulispora albinea TaxID=2741071 RepID=A0ABZ2MCT8_9BACT
MIRDGASEPSRDGSALPATMQEAAPPSTHGPAPAVLSATFRAIFESEFGFVCRSLRRLGVREADLQDVAQELFVTVHQRHGEYDPSRPLRTWLFSFSLRFAANYRRLARVRGHVSDDVLERRPASRSEDGEARDLVLRGLEALDFDRRTVIVMCDLEGFAAPEVAEQLGIPLNTVYSRLRLAREDFREAIARLDNRNGTRSAP